MVYKGQVQRSTWLLNRAKDMSAFTKKGQSMKKYLRIVCCLYVFGVCLVLTSCGQDDITEQNHAATYDDSVQDNTIMSEAEETKTTAYPIETVYTDEEHDSIEYGNISILLTFFHLTKIVEEEDKITFIAELDADKRELPGWADKPINRTYIISREENLVINDYREAMQYFERISEFQAFRSYSENEEDGFCAVYAAVNGDKAYYLAAVTGEDGFYFIEAENDSTVDYDLMWHTSDYIEYEYELSEVECGQDSTAQLKTEIFYQAHRAEYEVTSDPLSYTAELQITPTPTEEDRAGVTNTLDITIDGESQATLSTQWKSVAMTYYRYPMFLDANADGYIDFLGYIETGTRSSYYYIFVWDMKLGQYAQAVIDGEEAEDTVTLNSFPDPVFEDGYVKRWFPGSYSSSYQCFRWEGTKLVLDDEYQWLYDEELEAYIGVEEEAYLDGYREVFAAEDAKRAALIYLDEDSVPELLILKNGEYKLYTFDGSTVKEILMPNAEIKASAYGLPHDFQDSTDQTFYWFEHVPYEGLIRVHSSADEERHDYYLRYSHGSLSKELETMSTSYEWHTYNAKKEIANEEFLTRLSDLGYDKLIPCEYLYESVAAGAFENIGLSSDNRKVLEDFVNGEIDAVDYVEEVGDIPEEGFVMKSYDEYFEYMTGGDEEWIDAIKIEYIDFDNDGEDEMVMCGYFGSCLFFDVIGDTVYPVLWTGSTTDFASVAVFNGKRVIEREDFLHVGREYHRIMTFDSCCCLVDWFNLDASFKGDTYTEEDEFEYRDRDISMEEFEEIRDGIQSLQQ